MSTKLYLHREYEKAPSAWVGTWTTTTNAITSSMSVTKYGRMLATTKGIDETSLSGTYTQALARFVSPPMNAYTFTGVETAAWIAGVKESDAAADMYFRVHIYVMKPDGTSRGNLLANNDGATEWTTTATGRGEGNKTLSALAASKGDRIVIEIGYQARNVVNTVYTGTLNYGATSTATDLTQASTSVTTDFGSLTLSPNLTFINTLYWVGHTSSTWDTVANWSDTSGGTGGIGYPDNLNMAAVFDSSSLTADSIITMADSYNVYSLTTGSLAYNAHFSCSTTSCGIYVFSAVTLDDKTYFGKSTDTYNANIYTYTTITGTTQTFNLGNNTHNTYVEIRDLMTLNLTGNLYTYNDIFLYWSVTVNSNGHNISARTLEDNTVPTYNLSTSVVTASVFETYNDGTYNTTAATIIIRLPAGDLRTTYYSYSSGGSTVVWKRAELYSNPLEDALDMTYVSNLHAETVVFRYTNGTTDLFDVYTTNASHAISCTYLIVEKGVEIQIDAGDTIYAASYDFQGTELNPVTITPWNNLAKTVYLVNTNTGGTVYSNNMYATYTNVSGGTWYKSGGFIDAGANVGWIDEPFVARKKTYSYKVYDKYGVYVKDLTADVISEPKYTQEINSAGSEMTIALGRNLDSFGEDIDVAFGNIVKIYITDGETKNKLFFQGRIVNYAPQYGETESLTVTLYSLGYELDYMIFQDSEAVEQTQATGTSNITIGPDSKIAQSFVPAQPTLTSIEIKVTAAINLTKVTVAIHVDTAGAPATNPIAGGISTKNITSKTASTYKFIFDTALTVTTGVTYWIVVQAT